MKKVLFYLSAVCVLLSFQGCPTVDPPVDPRDAFVGVYSYQSEGALEADLGITTFKLPLDGTGEFTITKIGEGDQVQLIGVNDTINASVSGRKVPSVSVRHGSSRNRNLWRKCDPGQQAQPCCFIQVQGSSSQGIEGRRRYHRICPSR